eukprot:c24659_g1_i4 orf=215-796(+)
MGFKSLFHHLSIAPSTALFRHSHLLHNRRTILHSAPLLDFPSLCSRHNAGIRMVLAEPASSSISETAENLTRSTPQPVSPPATSAEPAVESDGQRKKFEREIKRKAERTAYLFAAVASTVGIAFLTAGAVYYRFAWQTEGTEVPLFEMFGTFSLAVGASVVMEFWARWAHRALWHDSLWGMHEVSSSLHLRVT